MVNVFLVDFCALFILIKLIERLLLVSLNLAFFVRLFMDQGILYTLNYQCCAENRTPHFPDDNEQIRNVLLLSYGCG